jgi:hypothetical protein
LLLVLAVAGLDPKLTLHDTAQSIEHSLGSKILRRDQIYEVFLAIFLLYSRLVKEQRDVVPSINATNLLDYVKDSGVSFVQVS